MKPTRSEKQISRLLQTISPLPRLRILRMLGEGEACVCHLEALLGQRQAYISQHLMALREAGVVVSRREGRNIYYRLTQSDLVDLIQLAGALLGVPDEELAVKKAGDPHPDCACPHCAEEVPTSAVMMEGNAR